MRGRRDRAAIVALTVGFVLVALGLLAYEVEGSAPVSRPDGVGHGVPWSHELHARDPRFSCQSCHHDSRPGQSAMKACGECHPTRPDVGQPQPPASKAGDRRAALHASCVGCHKAVERGPVQCAGCHEPGLGTQSCGTCHPRSLAELSGAGHAGVACESCHGSQARLIEHDRHAVTVPNAGTPAQCLACHEAAEPDPAGMPAKTIEGCPIRERVDRDNARQCLSCHGAHAPRAARR